MSALEGAYVAYAAVLGAAVGSFLNVCVSRLPAGESVVSPGSHCPRCSASLGWRDNIPVLSWLLLRGRCRHCGEPISPRYPLVELAGAGIWGGMALGYGISWTALVGGVLFSVLLAIALVDARHYLIPDVLSLGGLAAGLALSLLPGGLAPVAALLGAATGFAVLWLVSRAGEWVFQKPAMGGGDVKMMAMLGAFLGPAHGMLALFLGAVLGSLIFGPVSLRTGRLVPFGVFLALGAAGAFLVGDALVDWYMGIVLAAG